MLQVSPVHDKTVKEFEKLFKGYYKELDCDENVPHLLKEYILPDLLAGLINIDLIKDSEAFAGFVIYQKDDIDNEWNFKEGWGDVREIYVIPSRRRMGLGKFLLYTAEMRLKERGIEKCYCLPCDGAEKFFAACGYARGNEYSEELDAYVYEKTNLNNGCKRKRSA